MMISGPYIEGIRARREAVRDIAIEIASGPGGLAKVLARHGASRVELRVTRDEDPASDGDVLSIGHAFSDIPRLLEALESGSLLPSGDAAGIGLRLTDRRRLAGRQVRGATVKRTSVTAASQA